jgi:hypothetical protein
MSLADTTQLQDASESKSIKSSASTDFDVGAFDISMEDTDTTGNRELIHFLEQPLEKVSDPLLWWWEHHAVYPVLSKMALDYLSIPGESPSFSLQLLN